MKGVGRLLDLPEKPWIVTEFEGLSEKEKQKVRDSKEWPEIAKYYDDYHDTVQHNVGEHIWRQRIGYEPRGLISFTYGRFIDNRDPCPNYTIPEWVTTRPGRRKRKIVQLDHEPGQEG